MIKYKRILIKVSGEALSSPENSFDAATVAATVDEIKRLYQMGVQMGIVVGGGNLWRGRQGKDMDRTTADYMGMLATVINALYLQDALAKQGVASSVLTAFAIDKIGQPFTRRLALEELEKGKVLLLAGGTGSPFFTTDTGAALRALEIDADVMLLAKNVDGIYDEDPKVNPNAKRYDKLTYREYLQRGLQAMDAAAVSLCADNHLPVLLFGLSQPDGIARAVMGENLGTLLY